MKKFILLLLAIIPLFLVAQVKYDISRYEKNRNAAGDTVSIFLAVTVSDSTDGYYYEHWLTAGEKDSVLMDENYLTSILENSFAEAEIRLKNAKLTKPLPSLIYDFIQKDSLKMKIDTAKIKVKKDKIKKDKNKAE